MVFEEYMGLKRSLENANNLEYIAKKQMKVVERKYQNYLDLMEASVYLGDCFGLERFEAEALIEFEQASSMAELTKTIMHVVNDWRIIERSREFIEIMKETSNDYFLTESQQLRAELLTEIISSALEKTLKTL